MYKKLRARFTQKITRTRLRDFLTTHRSEQFTLDVGAKKQTYRDLFPNAIAGDIDYYPTLDVVFDAHAIPFADNTFELVLCTEVLEHCHTPEQVLHEFFRVLKPGGKLILTTRFAFPLHDVPHDYFRFTKYGLRHLCRNFEQVQITEEALTIETMAVLMQRIGYQTTWRLPLVRAMSFVVAWLLMKMQPALAAEYGDIQRSTPETGILASGYYVSAVKPSEAQQ